MASSRIVQEAQAYSLDTILKDHYAVPDFQRPYVWKKRHVDQLYVDLYDAFTERAGDEYFIGSLVTFEDRRARRLQLVDGQQRMLTLALLFAACRDRIKALSPRANVTLFEDVLRGPQRTQRGASNVADRIMARADPDRAILTEVIGGEGPSLIPNVYPANQRQLLYAYKNISAFLEEDFGRKDKDLFAFVRYVLDNVYVVRMRTDSFSSALQIFETINARGVDLSAFDMVKNYLFTKVRDKDSQKRLSGHWRTITTRIEDAVGSHGPTQTSASIRFLRYFVMSKYDTHKVIQAQAAYGWIKENVLDKRVGSNTALDFAFDMTKGARAYAYITEGKYPSENKRHPLVTSVNLITTGVRQHYPLLMAAANHPAPVFDQLMSELERLVVIYLLAGVRWNALESAIPDWADRIRRTRTLPAMSKFTREHIRTHLEKHLPTARENLRMLGNRGHATQFYVLARMTEWVETLAGDPNGMPYYYNETRAFPVTIEHVLPQKPSPEALNPFSRLRVGLDSYQYQLGNLCLLNCVSNAFANNKSFKEKKATYTLGGQFLLTRSLGTSVAKSRAKRFQQIEKQLYTPKTWNPAALEARTRKMVRLATDIWDL